MPQLTAIEPQKRKKDRFNVYLDGQFAFGLDLENLVKAQLKIGQQISQSSINRLIELNELGKVYDKVLKFLSYRPRSNREVKDYLAKKRVGYEIEKAVIAKLEKSGLTNDFEFARWWVSNRLRFRPKGLVIIKAELIRKGVPQAIIERALARIGTNLQTKIAANLAQKQISKYKNLSRAELYKRVTSYLLRRGFDWQTIKNVIDIIFEKR